MNERKKKIAFIKAVQVPLCTIVVHTLIPDSFHQSVVYLI